ncbi:M3 family metallopeptidase [Nocardioides sp. cx-173]|uniref:M3 family metallopeptidase n=1 Tax=Nocardioides sp. cx-173 TaxID=2898796 RepID=UPI001E58B099|nr:M3 family metallopeptidase [Nocardioides sp. cx-173]MCD4523811.1 Zn-dependent oligopeptidase [Nocardioides sp. cx-173]UGB41868.1 Zn-dependent oligopeptidase [Nocardioides sp. cx-173]
MSLSPLDLPDADSALAWVQTRAEAGLSTARELAQRLRDAPPTDTLDALRQWDEVSLQLSNVAAMGSLLSNVHPLEEVRDESETAEQDVQRLATELSLDRGLYDVFAALDPAGLDPQAARLLDKVLEDFRRSGVDRDEETRARITAINERITELDQEFGKVVRDDVRTIQVAPERLDGLPADWREAHPAGDDGLVTVTTDYPDVVPVRMFAHDADVRRDLTMAFLNRGWPASDALLQEMFALRHELATLVGYDDWASYDADVKMIGTGPAIPAFIDKITAAAEEPMQRDLAVLLERFRQDHPDADAITGADASYYEELVRKEQLQVDAQQVRTYFAFPKVRQGLLDVTGRLFGLRYEEATDATLWADDVTAYDVYDADGSESFGRIYLDLHPREGKYKHAAQFTLTEGIAGRQLSEGVLVCNFSRGLMEHDHVVTLFHEFGHLVHHVLAGRGQWTRFAGVSTEWDFVEAPSQMLEEWAWDADVLRTFATDEAGEPIPADLVERMRRGDDFGKAYLARQQMFYAAMSYWFHQERPDDLTAKTRELQARYSPFPYIEDTHMFASFGHLGGYSSAYYTYMWSLVIAKDMFSAFDSGDLFAPETAARYRDRVLAPGGSKDAADLVADFLGRPYTFDAYAAWLAH